MTENAENNNKPDLNKANEPPTNLQFICYRNLMVVSFTYAFILAGVTCISNVQSSLNSDQGLGTTSLAVQTGTMIIQALFLNAIAIKKLGLKWCIGFGIILDAVYVVGNIYPTWATLIPAAAISGFGTPLVRTADSIYLIKIASAYATRLNLDVESMKTKFFYIYYVIYCASRVVGSVATSLILGSGFGDFDLSSINNAGANNTEFEDNAKYCGRDFCNMFPKDSINGTTSSTDPTAKQDIVKVYGLCAFSIGCMVVAFLLNAFFLQPSDILESDNGNQVQVTEPEEGFVENPCQYLLNTVKSWRNPWQLLLIPLSTYNGIDNAFMSTDFPSAFVTCYFGVQWVGFVVAWYGLTSPIAIFIASWFSNKRFRPFTFFVAFCTHFGVCVVLLSWSPTASGLPILFVLTSIWGIGSGLWPTLLSAFYGVIFVDNLEAAFSNIWLFDSLGALLTYSWGSALCTTIKISIYIGFLVVGICGYFIVEIQVFLSNKKKEEENVEKTIGTDTNNSSTLNKCET